MPAVDYRYTLGLDYRADFRDTRSRSIVGLPIARKARISTPAIVIACSAP